MKIRTRLTLLFTGLFATLLLSFALIVYFSSSATREEVYYQRLHREAITKANLLLDAKVGPEILQLIYKNTPNPLFQEEVAIYDTSFNLLYHDAVEIDKIKETREMIRGIIKKNELHFNEGETQAVGFLYRHNGTDYVITAAALDDYGIEKLDYLKYTLILALAGSILLTVFLGQLFARKVLSPVTEIVNEVEKMTATNLNLRINVGNTKDEIGELALTFNRMLNRLEHSFDAQKQFVSNISHELRTPLAAIIAELEIALNVDRTSSEYKKIIHLALNDAKRLSRLSTGLLNLAKASYDKSEINFKMVRLDELLLDAGMEVQKVNPEYAVNIHYDREIENESSITVLGNEYLLKVAFFNLIENGCKFSSNKQCLITIDFHEDRLTLKFKDKGIGISEKDLPHIFTSFYRGDNRGYSTGHGIGLSLTERIIHLHKGLITAESTPGAGSTFTVELSLS